MKKWISLIVAILMLLTLLVGCKGPSGSGPSGPDTPGPGLKGAEAAKLLLAGERLDAQLLKNEGDIFEDGAKIFRDLAAIAQANFADVTYAGNGVTVVPLSLGNNGYPVVAPLGLGQSAGGSLKTVSSTKSSDGSVLEIDGDTYKWSNFAEYSNSHDYFSNITNNVVSNAEMAADLIDRTKKNVRVVDKWVDIWGDQYYLHVEDNCEILFNRQDDFLRICKRSKNEQGVNVYEVYQTSPSAEMRMTYIPGRKYEYTMRSSSNDTGHNFIAENTKGFWEVLDVGGRAPYYNVSLIVLKDDICYDAFYNPNEDGRGLGGLQVISADRKTDILRATGILTEERGMVELSLQSFDGIKEIRIEVEPDKIINVTEQGFDEELYYLEQDGQRYYMTSGLKSAEVVLNNGMVLRDGDRYLDGRVEVRRTLVSFSNKENGSCGYTSAMDMEIIADTYEKRMETLREFLALTGLVCKRDMDYVRAGITQAYAELDQLVKYKQWNESPILTGEDIAKGCENLDAKYSAWQATYDAIKDAEMIDFSNTEIMELNIHFAPITAQKATVVKNEGLLVSVTELALTVEDTTLLVENEPYMVNFALVGTGSQGLTHVTLGETQTASYDGGSTFTVTQTTTFEIPVLVPGDYTVVAYISTADGIRMSGYTDVVFTEVAPYEGTQANLAIKVGQGSEGQLAVSYEYIREVEVAVTFESEQVTYAAMHVALSEAAYTYGFAMEEAMVEVKGEGDTWTSLTGQEEALASGTYRLKYQINNGETHIEGYVYTRYGQ
ncbi:MAG: hypothetical protein E7625_00570 [Ruminococcaceae bacterium]|nr:hypothetical protein [Oscillospiraceae bacterium]